MQDKDNFKQGRVGQKILVLKLSFQTGRTKVTPGNYLMIRFFLQGALFFLQFSRWRKGLNAVQICTFDHYEQILEGFS